MNRTTKWMLQGIAMVLAAGGMAACGDSGGSAASAGKTTTSSSGGAVELTYAEVADDYAAATVAVLEQGRTVVDQLVSGDVAAVYERSSPQVKAKVPLEEVERAFAEELAAVPIGSRLEERAIPLSRDRSAYFADHARGAGRMRFRVVFDPTGLQPLVEPVLALPQDPRADRPATARLRLPFDGLWWALEAPTPEIGNHHAVVPDQRHAFDFVMWRDGSTYRGDGVDNDDYWAWNEPVVSPAAGVVVAVHDGMADNQPQVETDTAAPAGNHVVIDIGNGEFAALAHFRKGSIRVKKGDEVEAGQVLGRTGNSGNSSEPHIHFHVQDSPSVRPGASTGVPVRFEDFEADGVRHDLGTPTGGQFVAPAGRRSNGS